MSDKDRKEHLSLLSETGRLKLTKEQKDTIELHLTGVHLALENPEPDIDIEATMDLPILGKRFPK